MYCAKCGRLLNEDEYFCPACGTATQQNDTGVSVVAETSSTGTSVNAPSAETYAKASSALTKGILSLVFSCIPVLSIVGIILGAIGKKKAKQARIENGGYFAKCRVAYILSSVGLGVSIAMTIFWPLYIALIAGVIVNGGSLGYYYSYR